MTFVEKSAWIMIIALLLAGWFYFNAVIAMTQAIGATAPPNVGIIAVATVVIVAIAIFGHVIAAVIDPASADAPEDERDTRIAQRAGNFAGWVLSIVVMVGIWNFAVRGDGNMLFHILVMGMVLSQLTEYALKLWFYRRGV